MKAPTNIILYLPLIGDDGELVRFLGKRTPHVPRVGESLFIFTDLYSKVVSVEYMGNDYNIIVIRLEPISSSLIYELTEKKRRLKWKGAWTYSNKKGVR